MKRKVIRQGHNTLTITLPTKWASKYGIKAGDELELNEKGRNIILKSNNDVDIDKVQINASNMNERVLRWIMSAAHKTGYDEIEVLNSSSKQIKIIHELIKELYMGFSIIEQTSNRCVLKAISKDVGSDFHLILRRAFLVTNSMAEGTLDILRKKDYELLNGLIGLEHSNNQLTNFCERIINKIGHEEEKKNCFYYVIAWNLEKICDDYKYICEHLPGKKLTIKKEILDLLEETNKFFKEYYEIFYKFDIDTLSKLADKGKKLLKEARSMSRHIKHDSDFLILNSIIQIVLKTRDFSASYVAIKEFKE